MGKCISARWYDLGLPNTIYYSQITLLIPLLTILYINLYMLYILYFQGKRLSQVHCEKIKPQSSTCFNASLHGRLDTV